MKNQPALLPHKHLLTINPNVFSEQEQRNWSFRLNFFEGDFILPVFFVVVFCGFFVYVCFVFFLTWRPFKLNRAEFCILSLAKCFKMTFYFDGSVYEPTDFTLHPVRWVSQLWSMQSQLVKPGGNYDNWTNFQQLLFGRNVIQAANTRQLLKNLEVKRNQFMRVYKTEVVSCWNRYPINYKPEGVEQNCPWHRDTEKYFGVNQ